MKNRIEQILDKKEFTKEDIIELLNTNKEERNIIYKKSAEIKATKLGNKVYFRGLIEFSNYCKKNCFYCGIRAGNKNTERYEISEDDILQAARYAYEHHYGSIVLQSGERSDQEFIDKVDRILQRIKEMSKGELGITISLGEQTPQTYKRWFNSGAHRYLLRVETSNRELYSKIHPDNKLHSFDDRIECLRNIKKIGYQTGTGVMIGLPFQTVEHLADDLLFFKEFDTDMVGMGPYLEHAETPLYDFKESLWPVQDRFDMAIKMVSLLRIMMPEINIAATTALQAIDPLGREKALKVGANIIMPNITPTANRKNYQLYENKPCIDEAADDCTNCLEARVQLAGDRIAYSEWGDSIHFKNKLNELNKI